MCADHESFANANPTSTPGALADLARAGKMLVQRPHMHVLYEVHHLRDWKGYLENLLSKQSAQTAFQALCASSNGLGVMVGTRTSPTVKEAGSPLAGPSLSPPRGEIDSTATSEIPLAMPPIPETQPVVRELATRVNLVVTGVPGPPVTPIKSSRAVALGAGREHDEDRIMRGDARPNPTFLYESADTFEGLIELKADGPISDSWDAAVLLTAVKEVTKLAVQAGAPLRSIQCPAQVPLTGERFEQSSAPEKVGKAFGPALRFSISLREYSVTIVHDLARQLISYCAEHGYALWTTDTRAGYKNGDWHLICEPNEVKQHARRKADERVTGAATALTSCVPVTFVGPARVGSSAAIVKAIAEVRDLGIAAVSITAFDELAFIHLQITSVRATREVPFSDDLSKQDVVEAISRSIPMLFGLPKFSIRQDILPELIARAGDYDALVGPRATTIGQPAAEKLAIWLFWEMERVPNGLHPLISALGETLRRMFADSKEAGNIEYLVCRRAENATLRGRAKLSLLESDISESFRRGAIDDSLSRVCRALEDEVVAHLRHNSDPSHGIRQFSVHWREPWLGHWSASLQ